MSEPFIGEIRMFAGNFAPRGWAFCNGELLAISSNTALFSLLGVAFGGDGRTTFGLPDLRGRMPMHAGMGPGLTPRSLGARGGVETVTLTTAQLPSHSHALIGTSATPTTAAPTDAQLPTGTSRVYGSGAADAPLAASSIQSAGGSSAHENMPPYLTVNFIIALQGIYPSRS